MTAHDLINAETRQRNQRLGLLLGLVVVGLVVTFIVLFTRHGLPKDPQVWRQLQAEEAARNAP